MAGVTACLPERPSPTHTLHTERLAIRPFTDEDAAVILELVNDADWLRFIGHRQVHSQDDARRYQRDGSMAMQARLGHGLCCVVRRSDIDNTASARVLEAVGLRFERLLPATSEGKASRLFGRSTPA